MSGRGKRPHAGKFTRPFGCGRTDDKKGTAQVTTMSAAEGTRRDFLYIATGAVATVGAAGVLWPLIAQMNPDASTIAAAAPIEVDLTPIADGQVDRKSVV